MRTDLSMLKKRPVRRGLALAHAFAVLLMSAASITATAQPALPTPGDSAPGDESISSLVTYPGLLEAQNTIVSANNVILYNFRDAFSVAIATPVVAAGTVTGAVVAVNSGGAAFPAVFAVVDHVGDKWLVSETVGSCSDQPTFKYSGNTLFITFPPSRSAKEETWRYGLGKLQKVR